MTYIHLHLHSDASLLDGLSKVKQIAKKAKEYGQPAVALTDHGNIFNAINFYKACQKEEVKPILGCEFYFCPNIQEAKELKLRDTFHLVLLAENLEGWHNIVKLVTLSNTPENFYYKPKIDFNLLKEHNKGIIALTACMQGIVPYYLSKKLVWEAREYAGKLHDIFGDSLYFETQNAGLDGQLKLNESIRNIAKFFNRPVVGTVDSHYINREDSMTHMELMVIGIKNREYVANSGFGSSSEFYFKKREEVDLPDEELDNTLQVAERCNVTIDLTKQRFPTYTENAGDLLKEKLRVGWKNRLTPEQQKDPVYIERAKKEITDITEAGFADYFLMMQDIVCWAKDQNIWIGASRGSVAGSLLAYLLRITEVDPIKYNLIFERFYNKGRVQSAPDIDTDIELRYRKKVIDYIREKFGAGQVSQLMTLNTMAARAAVKDIMRVQGIPFDKANEITSLIPMKNEDHTTVTLESAIEKSKALKEYEEDPEYQQCFKHARKIEGVAKSVGKHAAAVIISDKPFTDGELPLVRSPDGKDMICGWDMKTIDALNILKCDALGLATLELLHRCCDLLKETRGKEYSLDDLYKFNFDDVATYDMICSGWIDGVFQIESHLGKKWSKALLPRNLYDIAALISLIRPGTLDNNMTEEYRKARFNEKEIEYIHPSLEPILASTNGIMVYQEQVLKICNEVAKMSLQDADSLRKAMGKKLPEEMAKWKETFIKETAKNSGMPVEDAEAIWGWIEAFAGYGFNAAHAIGYSMVSYWTAFFKANYTVEFLCACLMCTQHNQKPLEEVKRFVNDAKLFDINVLPPDIRVRNMDFIIDENNNIRFGLSHIKALGDSAVDQILNSDFKIDSFYSFVFSCPLNKSAIVSLICSGALDCFDMARDRMLQEYNLFKEMSVKQREILEKFFVQGKSSVISMVRDLANDDMVQVWKDKGVRPPNIRGRAKLKTLISQYEGAELSSNQQIIDKECEYLGISTIPRQIPYRGSHTCLQIKRDNIVDERVYIVAYITDIKNFLTKKNKDEMAFVSIEDDTYMLDGVVIFPKLYSRISSIITEERLVNIWGKVDKSGILICDRILAV
jgi:DNA polymerase-3 subunit alpha